MSEIIKVTYISDKIDKLTYVDGKSDWIDLRSAEDYEFKKGDFKLINLGVSICLPDGYEAIVVPRSSTYKNFGLIQTNHCGVIDESYGKYSSEDIWYWPALAMRDTKVSVNDRICQFRIQKHQPKLEFVEVEPHNDGEKRGGFGSTGKQ